MSAVRVRSSSWPGRVVAAAASVVLLAGLGHVLRAVPSSAGASASTSRAAFVLGAQEEPAPPAAARRQATSRSRGDAGSVRRVRAADVPPGVEARGRAALAAIGFPWQRLGYDVVFTGARADRLATTNRVTRTITVHVRPGQSRFSLRVTLAHEIGHALDFVHGTEERRRLYREIRGLDPRRAWFPCSGCEDYDSPAGDWAEVFAYAVVGPGDFRSRLAAAPDRAQLQSLA